MQNEYKGYFFEETPEGAVRVYSSTESWMLRRPEYVADNEYLAKLWVDLLLGEARVSAVGDLRLERTTTDKILDDLERTWHRIESDMSTEMQSALGILKEVMGHYYEEPCVVVWDDGNLVGVAVYETYDDVNLGTRETHIKELASFIHGLGIGGLLVQEVIEIAREEGSHNVTLSHGPGAKSFYESLGFVEDTRLMPAGEVGTLMMYKL